MAYLYRKKRPPFWYVVYVDADQKERHKSTGFLADDPTETNLAKELRAEKEAAECRRAPGIDRGNWDGWVTKYLHHHCESPRTLERYLDAWKWLSRAERAAKAAEEQQAEATAAEGACGVGQLAIMGWKDTVTVELGYGHGSIVRRRGGAMGAVRDGRPARAGIMPDGRDRFRHRWRKVHLAIA